MANRHPPCAFLFLQCVPCRLVLGGGQIVEALVLHPALAAALQSMLHDLATRPADPRWHATREAGFDTARDYAPACQEQALLDFWRPRIG